MKKLTCIVLLCSFLNAGDEILSQALRENLDLKENQVNKSSDVLENSWINPLNLSIQKSKNKNSSKFSKESIFSASIGLNQDIFRSGGIFYAIKYADASRLLGLSQIKNERNSQTINAYTLLVQILKNDKLQAQQKLYIQNSILDIKRKKEQYLAGLIDISFLNNSILEKITRENALLDLKTSKQALISEFEKLSDKDYLTISLPEVKKPTIDEYLANNLTLLMQKNQIKNKKYSSKLTKSQYLPKISIGASYNYTDTKTELIKTDDDFYNYSISASMPLDIKTFDDIQSSRLEYLISQNEYQILAQNQQKEYDRISKDLDNIDKKISLAKENIGIYDSLLTQTKELVNAQIKIKDDLTIMENSKQIRLLQLQIHKLEKNEKKLEFYKNFINSLS